MGYAKRVGRVCYVLAVEFGDLRRFAGFEQKGVLLYQLFWRIFFKLDRFCVAWGVMRHFFER